MFAESITFLLCFSILRLASGGFHLKTTMACNIVTILLSTLLPFYHLFQIQLFGLLTQLT
ncbi:accessory gene regulator B family protein [Paenibacillus rhizoplanae]